MLAIPDRYRVVTYTLYALAGVAIGSTQVAYAAAELGQPTWLTVALAVYAYVGGAFGWTAATHTPNGKGGYITGQGGRHYDLDGDGQAG